MSLAALHNKSIIVTGAGGGIGRASCIVFAEAGARLIVTDIDAKQGDETVSQVKRSGGEASFVLADLRSEEAVCHLVDSAVSLYGRLDGAFNNAAIDARHKPLTELTLEQWDAAICVNLTAVFLCLKYQILAMLKTGGGSIVNTSSSLGQVAITSASEYVAAKHGVIGLTRAAGADYGATGVRVNAILPGIIKTPMLVQASEQPVFAAILERQKSRHSIGRFGEPFEIGQAAKWLLSDQSSFVNGTAVPVDGGYLSI